MTGNCNHQLFVGRGSWVLKALVVAMIASALQAGPLCAEVKPVLARIETGRGVCAVLGLPSASGRG